MKVTYQYTEYKDFPEATMISQDRERNGLFLGSLSLIFVIISVICLFTNSESFWSNLFGLLLSVAFSLYMFLVYPRVTEKKIQKAIRDRIQLEYELTHPSYVCKSITLLAKDKPIHGKCWKCYRNDLRLTYCKVRLPKDTTYYNLCDECIEKFRTNLTEK